MPHLPYYAIRYFGKQGNTVAIKLGEGVPGSRGYATTGRVALGRQGTEPVNRASENTPERLLRRFSRGTGLKSSLATSAVSFWVDY